MHAEQSINVFETPAGDVRELWPEKLEAVAMKMANESKTVRFGNGNQVRFEHCVIDCEWHWGCRESEASTSYPLAFAVTWAIMGSESIWKSKTCFEFGPLNVMFKTSPMPQYIRVVLRMKTFAPL